MNLLFSLLSIIISSALLFGIITLILKRNSLSSTRDLLKKKEQVDVVHQELERIASFISGYASPLQLQTLEEEKTTASNTLKELEASLVEVQNKINEAKESVRAREETQRLLKTLGEEQTAKITAFEAEFQKLSTESLELEKQLAESMKNLDEIISRISLTDAQKKVFEEFSNSLTEASARLRDLIIEYQTVSDRLANIKRQHKDLEDEYTRLIEKQLGI